MHQVSSIVARGHNRLGSLKRARLRRWMGVVLIAYGVIIDLPNHLSLGRVSLGGAVAAAAAFATIGVSVISLRLRRADRLTLAFALTFLSIATGGAVLHGFSTAGVQNLCVYFIFVGSLTIGLSSGPEDLRLVRTTFLSGGATLAVLGFLNVILERYGAGFWGHRGFALSTIAFAAANAYFPAPKRLKRFQKCIVFCLLVDVVLSQSRMATAVLVVIAVYSAGVGARAGQRLALKAVLVVSLFAATGALLLFSSAARERLSGGDRALQVGGYTIDTEGRTRIWAETWHLFEGAPFFGNGTGAADDHVSEVFGKFVGHPHNDYLRFLADNGVIGLALWAAMIIEVARRLSSRRGSTLDARYRRAASLALAGLLLGALTDNVVIYPFATAPLGFLLGWVISLSRAPHGMSPFFRTTNPTGDRIEFEPLIAR